MVPLPVADAVGVPLLEDPLPDAPPEAAAPAASVGIAKPVILPLKGPGALVAWAPTPLRFGVGIPGTVDEAESASAADWKASKVLPVEGALMALRTRQYTYNLGISRRHTQPFQRSSEVKDCAEHNRTRWLGIKKIKQLLKVTLNATYVHLR